MRILKQNYTLLVPLTQFLLIVLSLGLSSVTPSYAMGPSVNQSFNEEIHEGTTVTEVDLQKIAIQFLTDTAEYHFLKDKPQKDLWKSVTDSRVYSAGKYTSYILSTLLVQTHILTPCLQQAALWTFKGYDSLFECNPESPPRGEVLEVCSDSYRTMAAAACLLPLGYCLHKQLLKIPGLISYCGDQCSKTILQKLERHRNYPTAERLHHLEKSILRASQQLMKRSAEIRDWADEDRKIIFQAAASAGQIRLMQSVLKSSSAYEMQISAQLNRYIEEVCSICLEDLDRNEPPLEETMETGCKHGFHKKCLTRWHNELRNRGALLVCPLCQTREYGRQGGSHLLEQLLDGQVRRYDH